MSAMSFLHPRVEFVQNCRIVRGNDEISIERWGALHFRHTPQFIPVLQFLVLHPGSHELLIQLHGLGFGGGLLLGQVRVELFQKHQLLLETWHQGHGITEGSCPEYSKVP